MRQAGWVSLGLVVIWTGVTRAAAPIHTGSRATYVHRIQLFDEAGKLITVESKIPYSPKKTCGKCHDYGQISKGWHFQAGMHPPAEAGAASVDADDRPGEPFFVIDPVSRTQIPTSYRNWARDRRVTPADLGIKPFDFALRFGAYHPGGGVLENTLDKEGNVKRLSGEPWDKTGVMEIDCLMCHLRTGYNPEMRADQIRSHNLKWAPTAAAGLGLIVGEASKAGEAEAEESDDPFDVGGESEKESGGVSVDVSYAVQRFDKGNFVTLDITRHIPVTNCLFCHYTRLRDGGSGPGHHRIQDVHFEAGMRCTDCHKNDLGHRIARGDGSAADLARDPDNATLSCEGCHAVGRAGAPKPDHPGLPAFHLERIRCIACHSGFEPGPEVAAQLTAIGHGLGLSTEEDLTQRALPAVYAPVWCRGPDRGEIGLSRYAYPRWWGKLSEKGVAPLASDVVAGAIKQAGEDIKDDDENEDPEVNTDAEIRAVLAALGKQLADEDKKTQAVLVARGGVYALNSAGELTWSARSDGEPYYWAFAHPVRPARASLGSGGCTDCHACDAPFYTLKTRVDDATEPDPPLRSHQLLDVEECLVALGGWREGPLKTCWVWIIPIAALLCLLHYVTFGPKHIGQDDPEPTLKRFGPLERWMHLFLFGAFVALCATGLGFLLAKLPAARGSFWTSHCAVELHEIAGLVFAAAAVIGTLRWLVTAVPARYDWQWVRMLGGYLWIKGHPPAGKFNFGQKMFFWGAMVLALLLSATGITIWICPGGDGGWGTLAYTLHDLAAVLLMAFAVAHLYLTTIANPGTLRSIFTGRVTRTWAHHHHPNWAEKLGDATDED